MFAPLTEPEIDRVCAELCCPEGCRVLANDPSSDGICGRFAYASDATKASEDAAAALAALL